MEHGVLTNFLMLDLDENLSKASLGYFEYSNPISTSIKSIPALEVSSFLMLDFDETFSKAYLGYFEYHDTISSSIKNNPFLQDSRD